MTTIQCLNGTNAIRIEVLGCEIDTETASGKKANELKGMCTFGIKNYLFLGNLLSQTSTAHLIKTTF